MDLGCLYVPQRSPASPSFGRAPGNFVSWKEAPGHQQVLLCGASPLAPHLVYLIGEPVGFKFSFSGQVFSAQPLNPGKVCAGLLLLS